MQFRNKLMQDGWKRGDRQGKKATVAVAVLSLLSSSAAFGQSYWDDANGGDFNDASNWNPTGVPATDATVFFDMGDQTYEVYFPAVAVDIFGGGTVYFPMLATLEGLYVGDDDVTLDGYSSSSLNLTWNPTEGIVDTAYGLEIGLDSGDSGSLTLNKLSVTGEAVSIGSKGRGELKVLGGSSFTSSLAAIGDISTGNGTVLVSGSGSTFTTNALNVGFSGEAVLKVQSSGVATASGNAVLGENTGSSGLVRLTSGGVWNVGGKTTIGDEGEGKLQIWSTGGTANLGDGLSDSLTLGNAYTGRGSIHATGSESEVDVSGSIYIGQAGDAEVTLEDGATGSSYLIRMANESTSSASFTLRGEGTAWYGGALNYTNLLGIRGDAQVLVEDGAYLRTGATTVGYYDSSTSVATVRGAGSHWLMGSLNVSTSYGGNSTVNLETGGLIEVRGPLAVASNGTFNLTGGTLETESLNLQGTGFNFAFGQVHLTQDTTFSNSLLDGLLATTYGTLREGQHLSVDGVATLEGNLRLDGGTLSADQLENPFLLDFDSGTIELTGEQGMTVGYTGLMGEHLTLGESSGGYGSVDAQHLQVTGGTAQVSSEGVVVVHPYSSFGGGRIENAGQIELRGEFARLAADKNTGAGELWNSGSLRGSGQVDPTLHNELGGLVQVTAQTQMNFMYNDSLSVTETPGRLVFRGSGHINEGQIYADNGNEIAFLGDLANHQAGEIHVGGGAFATFQGGLSNEGLLTVSQGGATVLGPITNGTTGQVLVADASLGRFYGDVVNNGEITINTGSTAVFLGDVSGSGTFAGDGTAEFVGNLAPGNSPGQMTFSGDADLSGLNRLIMEISGYAAGGEYDHLAIGGLLTLGGTLDLRLLDGFMPSHGDVFQLFEAGQIAGNFTGLNLASLSGGLKWETSSISTSGTLTVVPEPVSALLFGLGGAGLLMRRRSAAERR